jgi:hypothetical protein
MATFRIQRAHFGDRRRTNTAVPQARDRGYYNTGVPAALCG